MPLSARRRRSRNPSTVVNCYAMFDKFFPDCGMLDYTEGIYHGDPATPYHQAQRNQLEYVLDEVHCGPGVRILEIGCGNGTLLEVARERGAEATGITICPEQVAQCRNRGLDARLLNYRDLDDTWTHRFDAVVANGSMEHFVQPRDAVEGRSDAIYREFFETCHRAIDPASSNRRFINTTIHFARVPRPQDLLKHPLRFRPMSDNFHYAMLARSFGGFYPVAGQLERCAKQRFHLTKTVDGTYDYHLTSEAWLERMQAAFLSRAAPRLLAGSLRFFIDHPRQYVTMLLCMLLTQSWNWQFRTDNPPTRLLRQSWEYVPLPATVERRREAANAVRRRIAEPRTAAV